MCEVAREDGCCRLRIDGGRWLTTGHRGGYCTADATSNLTVPAGFDRTDLETYVVDRLAAAGFETDGPVLLTGVDAEHARGARAGPVTVLATAGLSNPAVLPLDPSGGRSEVDDQPSGRSDSGSWWSDPDEPDSDESDRSPGPVGTVNLLVGTERSLSDGGLASLLATAVEAKTATLQTATGFTGTTSDAVAVGCDPTGEPSDFAGSATPVGAATRACVREAVNASLAARYDEETLPGTVAGADYGTVTDRRATVFRP